MCSKKKGINVEVLAVSDGWELRGARHWCRPKNLAQAKELTTELLWGLAAGLMQAIGSGKKFHLFVDATNLEFHPEGDLVLSELPAGHPLRVHQDVFAWHMQPCAEKGGE